MKRYLMLLRLGVTLWLYVGFSLMSTGQSVPGSGGIVWQKYHAPEGGIIHCIYAQDALVLAGTTEGAYRSEDTGQHWELSELNRQRVHCFLRLRDGRLLSGTERGIQASVDDGRHWSNLTDQFECTALYETADGTLFAGKTMRNEDTVALYTSTDDGASWQARATLHVYMSTYISKIFPHDSALYLVNAPLSYWQGADHANIHVSHDQGFTWKMLFPRWDGRDPLDAMFASSGTLIVGGKWKGVARSTDLGSTWSTIETGFESEKEGSVWSLLELDDGSILAGSQAGAFRSTDDGQSWTRTTLARRLVKDMTDNGAGAVFAATAAGVCVSLDAGMTWGERNTGISAGWFGNLGQVADGRISMVRYAEEGRSTLFRRKESSDQWDSLYIPDETFGSFHENDNGDFFTSHSYIWYSTDKGTVWQRAVNPSGLWMSVGDWLSYSDSTIVWGGNRSTDNGRTWTGNFPMYSTTRIAECDDGTLYSFDSHCIPTTLLRSTDHAATWEKVLDQIRCGTGKTLSPLALVQTAEGTILLGARDGVYRWQPGDSTFEESGLKGLFCSQVIGLPNGAVVVGTDEDGTFITIDNGATWIQCNDGLTQLRIWQMMLHRDGYLLAATEAGLFRTRCGFEGRGDLTLDAPSPEVSIVAEERQLIVPLRWIARITGQQSLSLKAFHTSEELSLRRVTGPAIRSYHIDSTSNIETILTFEAEAEANDTASIFLHFDVLKNRERDPVICRIALCPHIEDASQAVVSLCDCEIVSVHLDGVCNPIVRLSGRLHLAAFPNPVVDAIHIRYRLSEEHLVQGRILDVSGKEVLHLPELRQLPGSHEYVADVSTWPVGAYRVVLIAGEQSTVASFSILR